jgi:hypothetical protein
VENPVKVDSLLLFDQQQMIMNLMYIAHDLINKRETIKEDSLRMNLPRIIDSSTGAGLGANKIFFACLHKAGHLSAWNNKALLKDKRILMKYWKKFIFTEEVVLYRVCHN